MFKATYTCDQCGAEKKETNHWFAVLEVKRSNTTRELRIRDFGDAPDSQDRHICGHVCLFQEVSEFASRSGSAKEAVA